VPPRRELKWNEWHDQSTVPRTSQERARNQSANRRQNRSRAEIAWKESHSCDKRAFVAHFATLSPAPARRRHHLRRCAFCSRA
jgi:hypothetical protein